MTGQTFAALAQPFLLGSPTKLAAVWFGADERATANMIASLSEFQKAAKSFTLFWAKICDLNFPPYSKESGKYLLLLVSC